MRKRLACFLSILIGIALPLACRADPLPDTTVDGLHWRFEQLHDTGHDDDYEVAARRGEQVLIWDNGKNRQAYAGAVFLLVSAPYDQVQPLVERVLQRTSPVKASADSWQLQSLPDPWSHVLLSRRPDLRAAIADHATLPKLQQALQQGAITRQELDWRMDQARARVDRLFSGSGLPALQPTYAFWEARQDHSDGITGQYRSALFVRVQDTSAIFGHPATVVQFGRVDSRPNPDYSLWKALTLQDLDVFSGNRTQSSRTGISVVPADLFTALTDALSALPARLEIAKSPAAWQLPSAPSMPPPAIKPVAPDPSAPVIRPSIIRWDSFVTDPSQRTLLYPHDILGLPDGSLLFSAQVADNRGWNEYVWRLRAANGALQADEIWHGKEGPRQMMINGDGSAVWFDGQPDAKSKPCLYRYDIASSKVDRHEVVWPSETDWRDHQMSDMSWILDDDLPANFWHDLRHGEKDANPVGSAFLTVQRPASPPPGNDDPWPFVTTLSSVRQSLMDEISNGSNALIWPVRWRPSGSYWTEDSQGLAELDARTGRTLRTIVLPRRFGSPDSVSAAGVAHWAPKPLGSPQGQWIATGFELLLDDDGSTPPPVQAPGPKRAHFVGMHVVDLKNGHVLSALLGAADTFKAAARSANGRFLAMGTTYKAGGWQHRVALWDVAQGRTPVQLDASSLPKNSEIQALAFSWDGSALWAIGTRELMLWKLPAALRDRAGHGAVPDQSRN
ncbi:MULTISPECIES: WD40 repeat domain-containing protein [Burkholderia]|uniref:WD40 repeat domain-containing protein n=1 Tax=Burkholderia TaxID=32008 RepID=UPI00064FD35E|nr:MULTISPECIES: hypothetical protein [Burkholderia]KML07597.1 hypothetical protein VL00_27810 [Burkholderia cepacia]KML38749.1 hypothetical protein VL13_21010 [Burkholderia lata]KMN60501.1 hypothetical protein VK92_11660 [Burkholderia sp. LK4]NHB07547.1 hypothetical protein [Burkholderia cepacia]